MLVSRPLEKDVSPRIDEESSVGSIGRLPCATNTRSLLDHRSKSSRRREAILQIAPTAPAEMARAAFEIDRFRQIGRADNAAQVLYCEVDWGVLAISEAVRVSD
jgi:hypothetical protein